MQKQYNVQQEILKGILHKLFDGKAVNQVKNLSLITDIIFRDLKESALEAITHLMLTEKTFIPTKIGDYVKVIPPKYHEGSEFEVDVLEDMGLLGKEMNTVHTKSMVVLKEIHHGDMILMIRFIVQ